MSVETVPAMKCAYCGHMEGPWNPLEEVRRRTGTFLMHERCKHFYFESQDWFHRRRDFQRIHSNLAHWWTSHSILFQVPHLA